MIPPFVAYSRRASGVSYVTVRHAMQVLRERGIIITARGRGTFVKDSPQEPGTD